MSGAHASLPVHGRDVVRPILRLEGLAVFLAGLVMYEHLGADWLWFVPLLLVPDLSILGFVAGPGVGATIYDLVHNWVLAIVLIGVGVWLVAPAAVVAGVVLGAHVGLDRCLGYGLKHPTDFHDTHLQRA